MNFASHRS